jgi:malonyl CoA-acyl carrier protein transacylase/phosphopantetheinyl transferase (holo-ACP synthase)
MSRDARPLDLAVIGIACWAPEAEDLFAFWENVLADQPSPSDLPTRRDAFKPRLSEVVHDALADAGILDRMPGLDRVSVVIGQAKRRRRRAVVERQFDIRSNTRFIVDDSGFAALRHAALELANGRADLAVAGAIVAMGAGIVVLKRLAEAERDGNRIYAILKGLAIGGDAIARAYRRAEVDRGTVGYLEGVDVEDRLAFQRSTTGVPCDIGSSEGTGITGLIKAALCLHHRMLPPSRADLPAMPAAESRFRFNTASRPWINGHPSPRRAGIQGGCSGKPVHAVLEEHPRSADGLSPGAMPHWPTESILLAAENRKALAERVRRLSERLRGKADVDLKDLAATLAEDSIGNCRLGLVVESVADLITRLDSLSPRLQDPSCKSIRDARGTYFWDNPPGREGGLAFLFPGEGSQYSRMLADLCPHFPEVRALFDSSDRLARESGAINPPSAMLFGGTGETDAALFEPGTAVNLVLSSQWALYSLLSKLGLRPTAVVGHSSGEFLALAAAGAIRVDRRLEKRFNDLAVVFTQLADSGSISTSRLVGLATSREKVEAAIAEFASEVTVAVDNCPHQVVVAGHHEAVESVVAKLRAQGVLAEDLPFARAYHTPGFAPAIGPLRDFFENLAITPLSTTLYSCCSAKRFPDTPAGIRQLAIKQWTHTVEFRRTIEAMHADGLRIFVDVGARGNLAGFVEDTLRGKPSFAVAANLPRRSGLTQLNHLVASLFAQGVDMTPGYLFARRRPRRIEIDGREAAEPKVRVIPLVAESEAANGFDSRSLDAIIDQESVTTKDDVMRSHLATMTQFLRLQREVMDQYFAVDGETQLTNPTPSTTDTPHGPWAGEVQRFEPGRLVEVAITLDSRGDPVAEHHTFGGRRISAVDAELKGLPVLPFTVMAEMLAQVAARLEPGKLVGLRDFKARRWIRYEDVPITLEVVAKVDPACPREIHAALFNRGKAGLGETPEVEGVVVFGDVRDEPPASAAAPLEVPEPSRFDAHSMYAEQWLFHGPAMQAVSEVGLIDDGGIDGMLRVLPRTGLYRDSTAPRPMTDPIILDSFTHLLGLWGLDRLPEGDVVFPLRLGKLEIFGDDPCEGTDCPCRIRVRSVERLKLTVDAEILRPDGRVWMRLTDWDDWRFHWPSRYRDVFRQPSQVLLGVPLELLGADSRDAVAVWLQPPADMGRPVWRDVLEQCQLSPEERSGPLRPEGHEGRRTLRLWGRIAAKEAARRLWLDRGAPPVFPADFSILPDQHGRPILRSRAEPNRVDLPAISIAHTEGVAVALASIDPSARIGIDVERIVERSSSFEAAAFSPNERALLDRRGGNRAEWIARLWCAKEAAAKATGFAMIAGPSSVEGVALETDGTIAVRLGTDLAARRPEWIGGSLAVRTGLRNETVWAWVIHKSSYAQSTFPIAASPADSHAHFLEADAQ